MHKLQALSVLVCSVFVGAIVSFSVDARASDVAALHAAAFSDPTFIAPMPDDWVKQGIRYETEQPVDLMLTLDQQLYPILLPLIQEFAASENIKIGVEKGTCGISAGALARKTVDMGGFCCPPGDNDRLPGLRFHTIGIGSIALMTNPLNNASDLSLQDARHLFGGQISHWSGVPTSGFRKDRSSAVQAVSRQHCKPRPGHWKLIVADETQFSPAVLDVSAITDMINAVAKYPFSIGYETLWHIDQLADRAKVKIVTIDGVDPRDAGAVAAGRYPFYRVFNLTTWEGQDVASPMSGKLVAYLLANGSRISPASGLIMTNVLHDNGWKFIGGELTGAPGE